MRADRNKVINCKLRIAANAVGNVAVVYQSIGTNTYDCEIVGNDISATLADTCHGMLLTFCPNVKIVNNYIHDFTAMGTNQSKQAWGIYVSGNSPGSTVAFNTIIGVTGVFEGSGIHFNATSGDYGRIAAYNTIKNIAWNAFGMDEVIGALMIGNVADTFGIGVTTVNSGTATGLQVIGNTFSNYRDAATTTNGSHTLPVGTITVVSTTGFAPSGTILLAGSQTVTYSAKTSTTFTGCSGGTGTITTASTVVQGIDANKPVLQIDIPKTLIQGNYFGPRGDALIACRVTQDGIVIHANTTGDDRPRTFVDSSSATTRLVVTSNNIGSTTSSATNQCMNILGANSIVSNNNVQLGPTGSVGVKIQAASCSVTGNQFNGGTRGVWANSSDPYVVGNRNTGGSGSAVDVTGASGTIVVKDHWTGNTTINTNSGTSTQSGNAVTTVFNIAHGMGTTPTKMIVTPGTVAAAATYFVTATSTNIVITYSAAPPNAASNLIWYWWAEV
jgi:hypothetical protein